MIERYDLAVEPQVHKARKQWPGRVRQRRVLSTVCKAQRKKMRLEMQTYHVETTLSKDGSLFIKGLPFAAGDKVEVLIRSHKRKRMYNKRHPLRGQPILYIRPFDRVAENAWEALQ